MPMPYLGTTALSAASEQAWNIRTPAGGVKAAFFAAGSVYSSYTMFPVTISDGQVVPATGDGDKVFGVSPNYLKVVGLEVPIYWDHEIYEVPMTGGALTPGDKVTLATGFAVRKSVSGDLSCGTVVGNGAPTGRVDIVLTTYTAESVEVTS